MTYTDIRAYAPINDTDAAHVREIADSIKANGWVGAPILVHDVAGMLITGSHRLAAIKLLSDEDWDFDPDELGDIAEDVGDIIDEYCEENGDIPFDMLSLVFSGTWVEEYADQLVEW